MNDIDVTWLHRLPGWLWEASWQGTLLVGIVLLLQRVLGNRLSAQWRNALWLLVLARLILPVLPSTPFSIYPRLARVATQSDAPKVVPRVQPPVVVPREASRDLDDQLGRVPRSEAVSSLQTVAGRRPRSVTVTELLSLIWLAGFVAIAVRMGVSRRRWASKVRRCQSEVPASLQLVFEEARAEMRARRVDLVVSEAVTTPLVTGLWRPTVFLPVTLEGELSPSEMKMVLRHELAHVTKMDLWIAWLSWLVAAIHWFNPAIYWALGRARLDREMACDEWVLRLGADARAYGATLVRLAELNSATAYQSLAGTVGIFECQSALLERVRKIAHYRRPNSVGLVAGYALFAVVGALTLTDASDGTESGAVRADRSRSSADLTGEGIAATLRQLEELEMPRADGQPTEFRDSINLSARKFYRFPTTRSNPSDEGNIQLVAPDFQFTLKNSGDYGDRFVRKSLGALLNDEIVQGNPMLVRRLLKEGASPNLAMNENDESLLLAPLERAVVLLMRSPQDQRRREVVRLLLEFGGDPHPSREAPQSLLLGPVSKDMVELVKFLIDAGIDPRNDLDGGAAVAKEAKLHAGPAMNALIESALSKSPDPHGASKLW